MRFKGEPLTSSVFCSGCTWLLLSVLVGNNHVYSFVTPASRSPPSSCSFYLKDKLTDQSWTSRSKNSILFSVSPENETDLGDTDTAARLDTDTGTNIDTGTAVIDTLDSPTTEELKENHVNMDEEYNQSTKKNEEDKEERKNIYLGRKKIKDLPARSALSDEALLKLINRTDRGIDISPEEKEEVNYWMKMKEKSRKYPLCYPLSGTAITTALEDPLLPGLYDVAYVGSSQTQESEYGGNPAGGQYRGKIARMFYRTEGVYQHILNNDSLFISDATEKDKKPKASTINISNNLLQRKSMFNANKYQFEKFLRSKIINNSSSKDIVVINYISGMLLNFFTLSVVLYGRINPTEVQQRNSSKEKFGTDLSTSCVTAYFSPPLLAIGTKIFPQKLFRLQVGPVSSVILDTPFLSPMFRFGKGSRGSIFIFKRITEKMESLNSRGYEAVLSKPPLQGKTVGFTLIVGSLLRLFPFTFRLISRASYLSSIFLFITGIALVASRGGIERDFDHMGEIQSQS